jgi:hypothetical protein
VDVGAMDLRARVAEAFAEGGRGGNAADQGLVDGFVRDLLVGVDGARAGDLADAQGIERGKAVRPELDAGDQEEKLGARSRSRSRSSRGSRGSGRSGSPIGHGGTWTSVRGGAMATNDQCAD